MVTIGLAGFTNSYKTTKTNYYEISVQNIIICFSCLQNTFLHC